MYGLFLNLQTNKNIWISYSLKTNIRKKNIYKEINSSVRWENIQGSSIDQKPNGTMSVMLFTGATLVKKNFCLVARIVSCDTVGLHLLTFRILEPYTDPNIMDLISVTLSHINDIIIVLKVLFESMLASFPAAKLWWKYSGLAEEWKYSGLAVFKNLVEKIFENLHVRLKFSIWKWKVFVKTFCSS